MTNFDVVNSILRHPDIWPDIAPDGVLPFDIGPRDDVACFLVNGDKGVIFLHEFRDGAKIHPNFLPEHRGRFALNAISDFTDGALEIFDVVYAEIRPDLRHVAWAARHCGFKLIERGEKLLFAKYRLDA